MLLGEEFVQGIEHYGRWHIQEYVARSQELVDVLTYLRAERMLEMFKAASFITVDSVHFLKRTDPPPVFDEGRRPIHQEDWEI